MISPLMPKISIDLSGLEKIRRDAMVTRDSLLTEEETEPETIEIQDPEPVESAVALAICELWLERRATYPLTDRRETV